MVEDGGRTWLQYWFWLYYNPKNLFGFGKHEGDWEMIQIGLDAAGKPELIGYAQHNSGESRKPHQMEWVERDGGRHPVVYVSPYSHASYFESGAHPYPIGTDHPAGGGPEDWLPVEGFGPWVNWPGHWGNSERVIAKRIGNGPSSPSRQNPKWESPGGVPAKAAPALAAGEDRSADVPRGKAVVPAAAGAVGANRGPPLCGQLRHAEPTLPPSLHHRARRSARRLQPDGPLRG